MVPLYQNNGTWAKKFHKKNTGKSFIDDAQKYYSNLMDSEVSVGIEVVVLRGHFLWGQVLQLLGCDIAHRGIAGR